MSVPCAHENQRFLEHGTRWCDDCLRVLADGEGMSGPAIDRFTAPSDPPPLREWTSFYNDPLESDEERAEVEMSGMDLYREHSGRA